MKLWLVLNDVISHSNSTLWCHFVDVFIHFCQQYDERNGNWKCHSYFEMIDYYMHKMNPLKHYSIPDRLFNIGFKNFMRSEHRLMSELCYNYFNNKIMCCNNDITLLLIELIEKNNDTYFKAEINRATKF